MQSTASTPRNGASPDEPVYIIRCTPSTAKEASRVLQRIAAGWRPGPMRDDAEHYGQQLAGLTAGTALRLPTGAEITMDDER